MPLVQDAQDGPDETHEHEHDERDEKADNESGEPPASGGVLVSLDLARVVSPPRAKPAVKPTPLASKGSKATKATKPTIAEQLAAQKKRAKAEAEVARKAAKKARPGKGSSTRDALFQGFAQSLERASKRGEGFARTVDEAGEEEGAAREDREDREDLEDREEGEIAPESK